MAMMEQTRVLVCGSRTWQEALAIWTVLDGLNERPGEVVLIHGDAKGADTVAAEWAMVRDASVESYPADWDRHGKRAGYVRNQQMLAEGKPDMVWAFRSTGESKGTDMMIDLARKAGITTYVVTG